MEKGDDEMGVQKALHTELQIVLRPVTEELLREIVQCIVRTFAPEKIILFGSYASGSARPGSDIDLLIIMESDERPAERSLKVAQACRPRFVGMDILVRTPAELARRLEIGDSFFKEIVQQGKVLYER